MGRQHRKPSDEILNVASALTRLRAATRERDKARGECDHSWGYYGDRYEEAVEEAAVEFEDALMAWLDRKRPIISQDGLGGH